MKRTLSYLLVSGVGVCGCILVLFGCEAVEEDAKISIRSSSQALLPNTNLFFVSDVTECDSTTQTNGASVKALADGSSAPVLMTEGNNCGVGIAEPYDDYFDDIWGDQYSRIAATPGNHDYITGIGDFEDYFGTEKTGFVVSTPNPNWKIIKVDTNYPQNPDPDAAWSEWFGRMYWLYATLVGVKMSGIKCVIVYGHHPRFSSGLHGSNEDIQLLWDGLWQGNVELYLSGHDHEYERFYPMDKFGALDNSKGVVQIVAGTGGADLRSFGSTASNSAYQLANKHGLVEITLNDSSFTTTFVDKNGNTYDSYTRSCF